MDIFGLTIYFPYLCKVRVTKPFITFIIIICYMIGNGITIEESVAVSIKNLIINTYFKNTIHLKRFLETNRLVTLPPFDVEDLDRVKEMWNQMEEKWVYLCKTTSGV